MSAGVKAGAAESLTKDNKERPDLKKSNARRHNENQEKSHTKTIEPNGDDAESWVDRYGEILYRFALVRVKDPVDEICKTLNISATNCWGMLYRARMGLSRCLENNWIDDSN